MAAVAVCCLGGTHLLAVGGGVVASIVFGSWGIVLALVGVAARGVWRYPPTGGPLVKSSPGRTLRRRIVANPRTRFYTAGDRPRYPPTAASTVYTRRRTPRPEVDVDSTVQNVWH